MTETRPAAGSDTSTVAPPVPVEPAGLAGWLQTSDHKRLGRMWMLTSLVFLLAGGVLGALLGGERLDSGIDLLEGGSYAQIYTLHAEATVLLFLVPFFVGLATHLTPLQVGSPEIAFPRGSAAAYWGYLVSGLLLGASYLADGGISGGTDAAVDLYLLSLLLLTASLALGILSAVTTVMSMRAPGMTLLRTPLFSWSVVVGGGLLLLTLPIYAARLVEVFIGHHFTGEPSGFDGMFLFWDLPAVYLLVVMAAGVLLEVVPTLAGRPLRFHVGGMVVLGLLGIVGIGGWVLDPAATDDLLYVGIGLAAVVPPLALLGTLGDAARAGRPGLKAPLVLALGSAVLLLLGAVAGAVQVIEPLELAGTTWESGRVHLLLGGGATLAALAALWFWAPKVWGAHLSETAGFLVALLALGGAVLLGAPDLVSGAVEDQPLFAAEYEENQLSKGANALSLAGGALSALAMLVTLGAVAGAARSRGSAPATDDPWGGFTLEWSTTSPPPYHNFAEVPTVSSATPLRDEVTA